MGALSELVGKARRGVPESKLELEEHLRPLVHGLLLAWLPHRYAGGQVRRLIADGFANLATVKETEFMPALLARVRNAAQEVVRAQPHLADMAASDPALREAQVLLTRLRKLPEREREVLAMRLIEGIPGPELTEALGFSDKEIGAWLEAGLGSLHESGAAVTNDPYLWSLSGSPHPAVLRFENLLTPLRFDDSVDPPDKDLETNPAGVQAVDVTPISGPNPIPISTEGRRGTSEFKTMAPPAAVSARASSAGLKPITIPPIPLPRASSAGLKPIVPPAIAPQLTQPVKLHEPTEPSGDRLIPLDEDDDFEEKTEALMSDPRRSNPFAKQPGTVAAADLPAAAQVNPYAGMPGTVAANDLPAAAKSTGAHTGPLPTSSAAVGKRPTGGGNPPQSNMVATEKVAPAPPIGSTKQQPEFDAEATSVQDPKPLLRAVEAQAQAPAAGTPFYEEENPTRVQPVKPPTAWKSSLFGDADDEGSITLPVPERDRLLRKKGVWRGRAPYFISGMLAILSIAIAWMTVASSGRRATRAWNLVPVTVAAIDLSEGSVVTMEMISTRAVPEQFVTASVVKPDGYGYVIGQKTLVPVQAGDPLLWSHFEMAQVSERLSRRVAKKARGITVTAGGVDSVGGWVRPGDWVDVIVSLREGKHGTAQHAAVTLVQDVPVVATGKISEKTNYGLLNAGQRNYSTVSLLLLPEEAEMLTLAHAVGHLKFTLRNEGDHDVQRDGYITAARTLLDGERVRVLQMKRLATIQTIRSTPHGNDVPTTNKTLRLEPRPE